ncbi:MAG TPA: glycoside hydrolase family 99-like domain-containing protein [Candidatus Acidoferrum sp.]|nr:glycoside hydrolase family 99-like domain-containing protein [Candidatus Acidoferrum sp.]
MKAICTIVAFLLLAASAALSQAQSRSTQVPHEVLAFYYTWYGAPRADGHALHWNRVDAGNHDISDSTHYPASGAYSSQDTKVIDRQIDEAKSHGITGFIATWWGQGKYEDKAFPLVLGEAEAKGFKATVYWETAPHKGQAQIDQAANDLVYLVSRYGKSKAFLKVNGKPVIFVYGRVMGQVPAASWPAITKAAHAAAGDFLLIADGYTADHAAFFDGVHEYNICGAVKGKNTEALRAWAASHYANAVSLARRNGRISCVTVIPGYDDTKIRQPGLKAERLDGEVYRVLWQEAIKARPDWVLITSWNEWHEGSEIEPSLEFGNKYLLLTEEYAGRMTGGQ